MFRFEDMMKGTTSVEGTGPLTFGPTPDGFIPFSQLPDQTKMRIRIVDNPNAPTEWEVIDSVYTASGDGSASRGKIHNSSNGGNRVSFSPGTKIVQLISVAEDFNTVAENLDSDLVLGGAAGAYTVTLSRVNAEPYEGLMFLAEVNHANPGGGVETLTVNSVEDDLLDANGDPLGKGDLAVGVPYLFRFDGDAWRVVMGGKPAISDASANAGRLTLTSGVAVTESDVTSATAVYFTPCNGNEHSIHDGSRWVRRRFSELTLTLNNPNHAANTNYDVFIYWDATAGTLKIGTGPAWSSDTSRGTGAATTEVELLDGSLVNAEEITLRNGGTTTVIAAGLAKLVGTIRTIGTAGQTEDSITKRFVSNVYNAMPRSMKVMEAASGWAYATAAYRYMNNSSANRIDFVSAVPGRQVTAEAKGAVLGSGATLRTVVFSIGLDRADGSDAIFAGGEQASSAGTRYPFAVYRGFPGEGRHFLAAVEYGGGADNQTWFGLSAYGVSGEVLN